MGCRGDEGGGRLGDGDCEVAEVEGVAEAEGAAEVVGAVEVAGARRAVEVEAEAEAVRDAMEAVKAEVVKVEGALVVVLAAGVTELVLNAGAEMEKWRGRVWWW